MIEINLIPDVKLELLRARKQRKFVISISILAALAAGALVILLSFYAFGVQTIADALADRGTEEQSKKLLSVKDLSKTLTIQNQLKQLATLQNDKNVSSRLLDIIGVTVPQDKNGITITSLTLDSNEKTIEIEAQAINGYEAMEVFKKTIEQTTFQFNENDEAAKPIKIATSISEGERRYAEDGQGRRVLRFALSFSYPDELFAATSANGKVVAPNQQRVTDSSQGVPTSLFGGIQ